LSDPGGCRRRFTNHRPADAGRSPFTMPRFAVLDHDWPHPHRDLFLERGGVLKAWRLPAAFDLTSPTPAVAAGDHRVAYLDYEGPVSGDRGSVSRWDGGELEWGSHSADEIVVRLGGTHLRGLFRLTRMNGDEWMLEVRMTNDPPMSNDQCGQPHR
jgi:hypothetical protein